MTMKASITTTSIIHYFQPFLSHGLACVGITKGRHDPHLRHGIISPWACLYALTRGPKTDKGGLGIGLPDKYLTWSEEPDIPIKTGMAIIGGGFVNIQHVVAAAAQV